MKKVYLFVLAVALAATACGAGLDDAATTAGNASDGFSLEPARDVMPDGAETGVGSTTAGDVEPAEPAASSDYGEVESDLAEVERDLASVDAGINEADEGLSGSEEGDVP